MKTIKLYNVLFPIWMLIMIPMTWIIVLPGNFIIDFLVLLVGCKLAHVEQGFQVSKKVILKTWIFGFLSDIIGSLLLLGLMMISSLLSITFLENAINDLCINPFSNLLGFIIMMLILGFIGYLIYFFNLRFSFKKLSIDFDQKKRMALTLAILTTPYFFLIPLDWIYHY
ncbi:MAG: hypothetical protein R3Y57_01345 [Erysipelotrichaceae bacterium]